MTKIILVAAGALFPGAKRITCRQIAMIKWPTLLLIGLLAYLPVNALPLLPEPYVWYPVQIAVGAVQGTGFFLQASNSVYLVTARHVLFNDKQSATNWALWSASAECTAHTNEIAPPIVMTLDLATLLRDREVRYSPNHDVAMVRFESCNPTNKTMVSWGPSVAFRSGQSALTPIGEDVMRKFDDVPVGLDIYLIGFPSSIGLVQRPQIDPSLPLLRKGIVAGKNFSRQVLVLDCPSFQGNSGGPIIGKSQVDLTRTEFPLVGVLVEWVPFTETWQNSNFGYGYQILSNSGYSIAEPMDVVMGMVWN
jgi:hypothetical protein